MDERTHRGLDHRWLPFATPRLPGIMDASDKRTLDRLAADNDDNSEAISNLIAQVDVLKRAMIANGLLKVAPEER